MPVHHQNFGGQLRLLLASEDDRPALFELIDELQPYDISVILRELSSAEQLSLLHLIDPETAAEILDYFEPVEQYRLLDHLADESAALILNQMSSDSVVGLFSALHPRQAERLFAVLQDPFQTQIRNQMAYPENTAGSAAAIDYIAARHWWSAGQTLAHLRKVGGKVELYKYIYILGAQGELAGVLSLRELILSPPDRSVEEIMTKKTIAIRADQDQEEAARLLAQYDFDALPVVGQSGKMVGVITVDDILDIIEEEATEDIHLLGGSQPLDAPYLHAGFFSLFGKRIVWLLLLFITGAATSAIMQHYELVLTQVVALAFFIPLLIQTGGNTGAQTSTMVIRAMAVGEITVKEYLQVIWREMRLGIILGLTMAAIGFLQAHFLNSDINLSLTVALSVIAVVAVGSSTGALLPIIGKQLRLDPAVLSAPVITTLVDIIGLLIYFQFARMILNL